ncbi:MAG: hypothetical protein M1343_00595 [Chloroflexi bacterium]|nr:hypothetical protein [Chloroflexota bacterium]MDA8186751.1 hypothetical protein [Dehalococcoidales bacterium]
MVLTKAMAEMARKKRDAQGMVEDKAGCAFGLVTRRGLEDLSKDFERLEGKINGLLFGVVATLILQVWKSLS